MRKIMVTIILLFILALGVMPVEAMVYGEQHNSTRLSTIPNMQS